MRLARLFWKLLRYRVAVMLLMFMLLGAALHQQLSMHPRALLLAAISLGFSYISATSSNDIADHKIDAINHPNSPGRPLITGGASSRDIWTVFGAASIAAIAVAGCINRYAAALMCASILINICYSLRPLRISYRTFLAPLFLATAYVCIPYLLGVTSVDSMLRGNDILWIAGLYLMFVGRILLKDFRDRKGDSAYHKPTFLLRYGKNATCVCSALGIGIGGLLLMWQTRGLWWLSLLAGVYLCCILYMLKRLQRAPEGNEEQIHIGVGAKMGNGLLITLLCLAILQRAHADTGAITLAAAAITSGFMYNFVYFLHHPERAVLGYKG